LGEFGGGVWGFWRDYLLRGGAVGPGLGCLRGGGNRPWSGVARGLLAIRGCRGSWSCVARRRGRSGETLEGSIRGRRSVGDGTHSM
jgi:hypothetical protein